MRLGVPAPAGKRDLERRIVHGAQPVSSASRAPADRAAGSGAERVGPAASPRGRRARWRAATSTRRSRSIPRRSHDKTLPNDRRATILNDRGVAYSRRQQPKEAIDDFNRAIQLYPEYAAVYNNRGNVLLGLGAVREAIKDFDRALVLAPGYAAAYSNRAGAYMKLGQVELAIADYTKAIALTPPTAPRR